MNTRIRIGTRGSALALEQTKLVVAALRQVDSSSQFETEVIASVGDNQPHAPLHKLGVGVFTNSLEQALLNNHIDIAVHSLKDLPTTETTGLTVIPVLKRDDPRDVLISQSGQSLLELPQGSRIGTGSPRRIAQLTYGRSELVFLPMRGNVETRIRKTKGPEYDGAILAAAGIHRLGLQSHISEYLSPQICTPAPGQAAIAVEIRSIDNILASLTREISDPPTVIAVQAERAVLEAAGSGCQLPLGAHATADREELRLFACITALDGSVSYRVEVTGRTDDSHILGQAAFAELVDQGAGDLIRGAGA